MRPDTTTIAAELAKAGIEAGLAEESVGVVARVAPSALTRALEALRDGVTALNFLLDMFAVDTGEGVELTYHLRSFARDEELYLRTTVPYDSEVPSAWRVHPAVLFPEREAAEMFGLSFPGHPNPKRLLTSDEVESPLLLKSTPVRTPEEAREGRSHGAC